MESRDPLGPFGAKEASEGAIHSLAPALTNAIHVVENLSLQVRRIDFVHVVTSCLAYEFELLVVDVLWRERHRSLSPFKRLT